MRRLALAVLAGLALPVRSTPAADAPLLIPTRDVAVTYRNDAGAKVLTQRVAWSAAARRARIEPQTPGVFVIIDYASHRMAVVNEKERSVVEMDAPAAISGVDPQAAGRYTRGADDAVAGTACTEWTVLDTPSRPSEICITADGVLLQVRVGTHLLAAATRIEYAPQDAALFEVPAGYAKEQPR